jgi:3-oxoacyl-[acyl-carrier protein] reductase
MACRPNRLGADMDRLVRSGALLGGVDILVLNHGGPPPGTALEITEAQLVEWFPRIVLHPIRVAIPAAGDARGGADPHRRSRHVAADPEPRLSNILRGAIVGWNKSLRGRSRARADLQHPGPGPS